MSRKRLLRDINEIRKRDYSKQSPFTVQLFVINVTKEITFYTQSFFLCVFVNNYDRSCIPRGFSRKVLDVLFDLFYCRVNISYLVELRKIFLQKKSLGIISSKYFIIIPNEVVSEYTP